MRKEVTLAIFFGTIIGLTVAYGIWRAASTIKNQPNNKVQETSKTNTQTNTKNDTASLEILSPENNSVSQNESIKIQGVTQPNSTIIASNESNDFISTSSDSGEFEIEIELDGGLNLINIFSIKNNQTASAKIHITYTTEIDTDSPQEKATLTSITGTITDISDTTLQLRSQDGEISQTSINSETTYANIINSPKKINFADLAIGDYIIAIGSKNEEKTLVSKRILVSPTLQEPSINIKTGSVQDYKKPILTLSDGTEIDLSSSTIYLVDPKDYSTKKTTTKSLTENSQVISTGRTLFVLQ